MSGKRTSRPSATSKVTKGKTAWKRLARMTDGEIAAGVAKDRDTFVPDAAWWQRAEVVLPGTKQLVSLRLDSDILKWFRRQGRGYQTKINAVLRSYVAAQRDRPRRDIL
jgi:uncharacterized protein (DUF4415 family)